MNKQQKPKSGFTIIEVVLVLAIAGLIFLMVFIALPALQRSQRDTQRRDVLGRVKVAVNNYMSSNRGTIPTSSTFTSGFVANYLTPVEEYSDPQTGPYTFQYDDAIGGEPNEGQIVYAAGRVCGDNGVFAAGKARDFAMNVLLESQNVPYCLDSR